MLSVPAGPSNLAATAQTPTSVAIVYTDNSTNETGFQLERAAAGGPFVLIGTLPASRGRGVHGFYDKTVQSGTQYTYRLRAVNRSGASGYAGPMSATTPGPAAPSPPPPSPADIHNLLFIGNSLTAYNNLPSIVSQIAVADGHVQPSVYTQAVFGWTLTDHLNKIAADGANNIISHSLPAGMNWDDVIMQDLSTRPTTVSAPPVNGNAAAFRADAAKLFALVHQRSPGVHDVLFETWARGADNPIYPSGYTGPAAMQSDLFVNYNGAAYDAIHSYGPGVAALAPAGEAWRSDSFARDLYNGPDEYHPSAKGSVLAALVVYRTTYHDNTVDIPAAKVTTLLSAQGLTGADWQQLTAVADGV